MNNIKQYAGVVALGILAIIGLSHLIGSAPKLGTAADCTSVTCFTTVGVLTSFQDDGTAIFNGATTLAGAVTLVPTGAVAASSTLQVTGATTLYGGLTVRTASGATSTSKVGCVQAIATSSATTLKLVFSTVATTSDVANNGFVEWAYGTCP